MYLFGRDETIIPYNIQERVVVR